MPKKSYQSAEADLSPLEAAVVSLVRLGVAGDSSSVLQLGRQILRRHSDGTSDPAAFRDALGSALIGATGQAPTRAATQLRAPTDSESHLPLALVEHAISSPEPLLVENEREAVSRLIDEHARADALVGAGLTPTRSLLISGPPGVGKTMTARYIASSLALPLVMIDLAGVMSSLLGRTGQNLRQALDYARSFRCVLLLDEFDALAKRRDDSSDVGELKRIVNVLLLELERWPAGNLLIAATNHPELLDRAVGRRFDAELELSMPDLSTRAAIAGRMLTDLGQTAAKSVIEATAAATAGWSGSDIDRLIHSAVRRAVMSDESPEARLIEEVMAPLRDSSKRSAEHRAIFCEIAVDHMGLSQRAVADLLGISHPTVGKLLKERKGVPARNSTGSNGRRVSR